jgi:biopolymer transport protein TolQ
MYPLWITPLAAVNKPVHSLLFDTGMFAKFILLILFVISVISWAVMWDRTRLYLRLRKKGEAARSDLNKKGLRAVLASANMYLPSVEGSILVEANRFFLIRENESASLGPGKSAPSEQGSVRQVLRNRLDRRAVEEISELEKYLVFLATTSGVAPFLGLLGTVWGIMSSFLSMGVQGTASIEVVGPGIAEALVTTIAGLGAAIPALVGYNLLGRYLQRLESRIDLFIARIVEGVEEKAALRSVQTGEAAYEKNSV